ncbi:hypothetical protein AVEN_273478-1 [Araneus ventricosus]|uniref:Uncharacterized protein n=1 Tax=Araneus ventricosus TaxID=182803 RepID=A0A4Y2HFK9_ARAVE|nr:hypothetical protein AVEN_273478-1 [Araneus ventricosus]
MFECIAFVITKVITPSCFDIRVNMKDRPPRQHGQALRPPLYNPHYERFMRRRLALPGYDLSSEMGRRVTPPLLYPSGRQEPAYLYGRFSSVNSRAPPPRMGCIAFVNQMKAQN